MYCRSLKKNEFMNPMGNNILTTEALVKHLTQLLQTFTAETQRLGSFAYYNRTRKYIVNSKFAVTA